ncbi:MAG: hypothetical protein Q8L04_09965 [Ignavibacteria bacterium]|nr:hypothetical protein [Ignavibacteria bacterium]
MLKDPAWGIRNLVLHDYTIDIANKLLDYENKKVVQSVEQQSLDNKHMIFTVRPDNRSQRQSIQNSVFLMPSTVNVSFQDIIIKQFNFNFNSLSEENATEISIDELINKQLGYNTCMFKLIIPREVCLQGLRDLRNMNINAATLFPGIDGQARSLNYIMRNLEDIMLEIKNKK